MSASTPDPVEFERGRADATRDIEANRPRLFWGTRGEWGRFLEELFRSRFGVEVEHTDCFVWPGLVSYREGYNSTVVAHIDHSHGPGAFEKAKKKVEHFRKELYARTLDHPGNAA